MIQKTSLLGPELDYLSKSMDLTKERASKLFMNVANAQVANYQRQDSDFNLHLDETPNKQKTKFGSHKHDILALSGNSDGATRDDGSSVDLERETIALHNTETRFSVLSALTKEYFALLRSAINEGKK